MDVRRFVLSLAMLGMTGMLGFSTPSVPGSPPLLSGRTIIIDPGHGGKDPGSVGMRAREAASMEQT